MRNHNFYSSGSFKMLVLGPEGHKMKRKPRFFFGMMVSCFLFIIAVTTGSSDNIPQEFAAERAGWWKTEAKAIELLFVQKRSIVELVRELSVLEPVDAHQAMLKINIMMRAWMNSEVVETLKILKGLCPNLENYQISGLYYAATHKYSSWDVARRTVEIFADNISELTLENRLVEHFENSGWSVDDIDNWFADMPAGENSF